MHEVGEREVKKVPTLRGRTIMNLFFESSTRTRASFEIAGKRLSADVVNFSPSTSSLTKAESILDTARTLDAMDPDAVIVRHEVAGVPKRIADVLDAPVINAGDGAHEHPTQALLDLLHRAAGEGPHRRPHRHDRRRHPALARRALEHLRLPQDGRRGARRGAADDDARRRSKTLGVKAYTSLREALDGADVVMALRIQSERLDGLATSRACASTPRPSASTAASCATPRTTRS